ncbi:DUF4271 domain-containing protein [Marivirga atlantica]|uniref:DUF4271 domain-containing protein n=1 Tax=Marivirga atlantica TaxID=1548457 RepID=A0A937A5Z2_9BACT|nr:DUF4271 domain-containing protein [Marivirga atlantica]MBL0764287.1 DUF4271 domain-containing protein [Marivirga atlantica]
MRKLLSLIIILSVFALANTNAQSVDTLLIELDKYELISADEGNEDFIFRLPVDSFPQNFDAVKLKSTKLFYVFFHDSIYGHSNEDNELLVYIPNHKKSRLSDMRIHSQNAQQKVFVSTLKKAMPKESQLKIEIQKNNGANSSFKDVFIVLLLVIITLLTIFRISYPKRFNEVFSVRRNFSLRPIESDNSRLRLFDEDGLFAAAVYIIILSFLLLILFNYEEIIISKADRSQIFITFLKTVLIFSTVLFTKVVVVSLNSRLFRINKINAYYIKEILNLGLLFGIILFLFLAVIFLSGEYLPYWSILVVKNGIIVFYLARVFLLYFKILKLSGFTYLYLFSYFCTTEILPLIIGLKYFY